MSPEQPLPPTTNVSVTEQVRTYWVARLGQSLKDTYMGIPMLKLPEDLRVYEHLLWLSRANVVIELGTRRGGSALWFRHRLDALAACGRIGQPRVISIDKKPARASETLDSVDPNWRETITLLIGDTAEADLVEQVRRLIPAGARCLVSEDTGHTYETTLNALRNFAGFVPVGGFFVVEDGHVDSRELRPHREVTWASGVVPALSEWLKTEGAGFRARPDLQLYGVTSNLHGYLERIA